MNNDTCAIIVLYNPDHDHILKFLRILSLQAHIICINNGCSEQTLETIKNFPNVRILGDGENVGLAVAQNTGIKKAKSEGFRFCCLFDQDSLPNFDLIKQLKRELIALIGDGETENYLIGPNCFDPRNNENYPATVYKGPFLKRVPIIDDLTQATFLMASGSFFSLNAVKDHLLLEQLFIDYVDLEWCFRLASMGWRFYVAKNAIMQHEVGDKRIRVLGRNISIHNSVRRYYLTRNCILLCRMSHIPKMFKLREVSLLFLRFFVTLSHAPSKASSVSAFCNGINDGLRLKIEK